MRLGGEIAAVGIGVGLLWGGYHELNAAMGNANEAGYAAVCIQSIQQAQHLGTCEQISPDPQVDEDHSIYSGKIDLGLGIMATMLGTGITSAFGVQLIDHLATRREEDQG